MVCLARTKNLTRSIRSAQKDRRPPTFCTTRSRRSTMPESASRRYCSDNNRISDDKNRKEGHVQQCRLVKGPLELRPNCTKGSRSLISTDIEQKLMSFGHSRCFVCFRKAAPAQPKRESGGVRLLFLTRLPLARGEIVELQPILDLDNPPLLTVSTTLDLVKRYKSSTNILDPPSLTIQKNSGSQFVSRSSCRSTVLRGDFPLTEFLHLCPSLLL